MLFHKIHSCNLCGVHELYKCVSSKSLLEHSPEIRGLWPGLHELCGGVLSNILLQKMICYKIHICNPYGLHELSGLQNAYLPEKIISQNIHVCNLYGHNELEYPLSFAVENVFNNMTIVVLNMTKHYLCLCTISTISNISTYTKSSNYFYKSAKFLHNFHFKIW